MGGGARCATSRSAHRPRCPRRSWTPAPLAGGTGVQDLGASARIAGGDRRHDDGVGALVTLEVPADSPVLSLPWIITIGPLSDDEDEEADDEEPDETEETEAEAEERPGPPSVDEIRAGFARIAARLTDQ